jgi:hypothetical protein
MVIEFGLAVLAAIGFGLWASIFGGDNFIDGFLSGNRGAIYGALASIFGSLLGFVITGLALILSLSSVERLAPLRQTEHYETLLRVFTSAMWALGIATIVSLVALVVDRDENPVPPAQYATFGGLILAVVRIVRVVWILELLVSVLSRPSGERTADDP